MKSKEIKLLTMKKRLKDILDYEQPTKYIVDSQNYSEEYKTPVLTAGKSFILGYTDETEGVFEASKNPVIIFDDFTSASKYVDFDFKVKSSAMKILHLVNPKDSLRYVYYAMQKIDYVPFSHKRLWISDYSNFEIELPDSSMQNRVVADLDTIQKAIDLKRKQLEDLDELVKSKFQEMFGNPILNDKKWPQSTFGENFTICSGGTPSTSKKEYWENGTISWIGSNMCHDTILYKNDGKFITEEGLNHSSAKLLKEGTVLVALVGATIGKTALLKFETTTNQNVAAIDVVGNESFDSEFVFYLMQGLYDVFMDYSNGKFAMASLSFVKKLPLIMPPVESQRRFAGFVKKVDAASAIIKQEVSDLEELMDSKMDECFG